MRVGKIGEIYGIPQFLSHEFESILKFPLIESSEERSRKDVSIPREFCMLFSWQIISRKNASIIRFILLYNIYYRLNRWSTWRPKEDWQRNSKCLSTNYLQLRHRMRRFLFRRCRSLFILECYTNPEIVSLLHKLYQVFL